jgi:hypothetical protein
MALPTAQLGQLGTMSMPYSIPTYEKGPSIWEKALASFLVSAAGQAAEKGTENLMSRDYASEFGEDPAKGFGRLMGPKVGEREAVRRRAEEEGMMMKNFELDSQRVREQAARDDQSRRDMRQFSHAGDLQDQQDTSALQRVYAGNQGDMARNDQAAESARELTILKSILEGEDPGNQAQTRYHNAMATKATGDAEWSGLIADKLRRELAGASAPTGQTSPVNPAVEAFRNRGAGVETTPSQQNYGMPPEQSFVSTTEDIARMLSEGRSPEEIIGIVTRQQKTNDVAQSRPLPGDATIPMRNIYAAPEQPQVDPQLAELIQLLGLSPNKRLYSGEAQLGIYSR